MAGRAITVGSGGSFSLLGMLGVGGGCGRIPKKDSDV